MDALAVRLTVPPVGSVEDFHLPVNAPCRAHKNSRVGKLFPTLFHFNVRPLAAPEQISA
jgi:hypothetical protein